eukprot:648691-Amphidinium_carterae.1
MAMHIKADPSAPESSAPTQNRRFVMKRLGRMGPESREAALDEEPPHWQAELRFNAQGTAGVLFRSDGHEAVMLRQVPKMGKKTWCFH